MYTEIEDAGDIKHKILFFFMPKHIVFAKKDESDTISSGLIKSMTPCFYWCSAHEFLTEHTENKFLIQHQIYFINGDETVSSEISQNWSNSKTPIRDRIISFLDTWNLPHEKILSLPDQPILDIKDIDSSHNYSKDNNRIYNFSDFAGFVARSIIGNRNNYINQTKLMNIDFVQKECWKYIALNPSLAKDARKFLLPNPKKNGNINKENNEPVNTKRKRKIRRPRVTISKPK